VPLKIAEKLVVFFQLYHFPQVPQVPSYLF